MAKADRNLYTVFHSLDNKGAFDPPDASNTEIDSMQGKYFQEKTEFPKMVYGPSDERKVAANAEEEAEIRKGFTERATKKAEVHILDARKGMEKTAKKLGVTFDQKTSDKKLAYLIEEAEVDHTK